MSKDIGESKQKTRPERRQQCQQETERDRQEQDREQDREWVVEEAQEPVKDRAGAGAVWADLPWDLEETVFARNAAKPFRISVARPVRR